MSKIKVGIDVGPLKNGHKNRGIGSYVHNLVRSLKKYDSIEIVEGDLFDDFVSVDLIHYPTFDLFQRTLPIQKNKPVVVTIHDVTPLVYPKAYPAGIKGKFNLEIQNMQKKCVVTILCGRNTEAYKTIVQILFRVKTIAPCLCRKWRICYNIIKSLQFPIIKKLWI
jgi:hypothetical protein